MKLIRCTRSDLHKQRVAAGTTLYEVLDDGILRAVGAPDPGVSDADAAEFLSVAGFREVQPDGSPAKGRKSPPPPRAPAAPPKAADAPLHQVSPERDDEPPTGDPGPPKGVPWGDPVPEEDPGTYRSRFPPEDLGHNVMTVAQWVDLAVAVGLEFSTALAGSKARVVQRIRAQALAYDRVRDALRVQTPPEPVISPEPVHEPEPDPAHELEPDRAPEPVVDAGQTPEPPGGPVGAADPTDHAPDEAAEEPAP